MTDQEKCCFDKLTESRTRGADEFEKPYMRGYKDTVSEKYSDTAHFVYELLQNADDAGATRVRFVLTQDHLVFAHNGTRHFSISDPDNEGEDSANGLLGDINAITSVGNSNKIEKSTIGKFGVGFKAVFQYTETPRIYDTSFRFLIERFIVPKLLEEDWPGRKSGETLFVFPFDSPRRTPKEAFKDISGKLLSLVHPTLFLTNLRDVTYDIEGKRGSYKKEIRSEFGIRDILCQHIALLHTNGESESLCLFSREAGSANRYSVGFFLNEKARLKGVKMPAFCFFKTKESTGLNFIIHAPFLLTDSREGILAGAAHNIEMVQKLAELAADSIVAMKEVGERKGQPQLIDDEIIDIIPVDPSHFSDLESRDQISFMPFYDEIKKAFSTEEIIPARSGFIKKDLAYWAAVSQLTKVFSDKQLEMLSGEEDARWVFCSLGRQDIQRKNKPLCDYIDSITSDWLDEDKLIEDEGLITQEFVEAQPVVWLHSFYKWLSATEGRTETAASRPFFLDNNTKATAVFDEAGREILFFPTEGIEGCPTVHPDLLKNQDSVKFFKKVGIREASLRDEIYNNILPRYEQNESLDSDPHFKLFFKYYCEASRYDADGLIRDIKNLHFLLCQQAGDPEQYRGKASELYMPDEKLYLYFSSKPDVWFLCLDYYLEMVGEEHERQLYAFFDDLGVATRPRIIDCEYSWEEAYNNGFPRPYSTGYCRWEAKELEGCKELLAEIERDKDARKSVLLWGVLGEIIKAECGESRKLENVLSGYCRYFYRTGKLQKMDSLTIRKMRTAKWLMDSEGQFVSAQELGADNLCREYDQTSPAAKSLIEMLGIDEKCESAKTAVPEQFAALLNNEQKKAFEMGQLANKLGLTKEDLEEKAAQKKQREEISSDVFVDTASRGERSSKGNLAGSLDNDEEVQPDDDETRIARDIFRRARMNRNQVRKNKRETEREDAEVLDADDYTPQAVDYSKRINRAKDKSAHELARIAYLDDLQRKATSAKKYSYGWLSTLLEMEMATGGERRDSKEISITFGRVEKAEGTSRTLILKYPSRYIPQFMEELADIPLILHTADAVKTVAIEVMSVQSYTLKVKLKSGADIEGFDLSAVTEATIDAKNPGFLLEELRDRFAELDLDEDYDLQRNLPENIEFVFGPPGTGKTTYLARQILSPLMAKDEDAKVLVLTPTNKAADVLTQRIMEAEANCADWLIRFGATSEEAITQSEVFKDKTFDVRTLDRSVTVTTIARFAYDYFMPNRQRLYLHELKWDYIVIDEASMIPIANILLPIYKKTPRKFIIAGDPFQIEPITAVNLWKGENIYTLVHLNSFGDPHTVPHKFKVTTLTMQYRSVPAIGNLFSEFAYDGILEHNRKPSERRELRIDDSLEIKSLNIIKFPVSKYESIYRAKRLQNKTSYQVYSALFVVEFVTFVSNRIAKANPGERFSIGIVAAYRGQADLLDRLLSSAELPKNISVYADTIHGFQGDECDIMVAVFNPPPNISDSPEMFLNKRNIINVSISRARDYFFMVIPDDNTENAQNLRLIKRVEKIMKDGDATEYQSPLLEMLMFGSTTYLEDNSFSTGHQSVNVYGIPERRYEIRSEDAAVDIQIHRSANSAVQPNLSKNGKAKTPKDETGGTVFSAQNGEGKIINRHVENGRIIITVQFRATKLEFDEELAFRSGTLKR